MSQCGQRSLHLRNFVTCKVTSLISLHPASCFTCCLFAADLYGSFIWLAIFECVASLPAVPEVLGSPANL